MTASTKMSPAVRRYTRTMLLLSLAYVAALIIANRLFTYGGLVGWPLWLVAILPALPVIGMFVSIGRLLSSLEDEYVRMLMVRQALVATGFSLAVCTALGFLGDFGLIEHISLYWAAVLWFAGLGLGGCLNWYLERDRSEA